ncbi:MAG TPA: response regulator [Verrucomicrobiae bacterium]|nr:response regulator [Verrucomicrobiae bacterium]
MATTVQHRRRILFVDDDPRFLEMIERVMSVWSKGSWEIHLAHNTGKALSIIQEHPINLVAIDVQMPVVDGLQFLTLLNRKYPNLQKVVLTGYANDNYRAACLSNGAELFLEKPTNIEGLESIFATLNEIIKWQPEEGFRGVLRRVGLQEVLQMECLSRNSSLLEITAGNEQGEIYIRDGAIIHAVSGNRKGEPAFNYLLALKGGEFRLKPFEEPPEQTITGSWEFLLMEAARMRDEVGQQAPAEDADPAGSTLHPEPTAVAPTPVGVAGVSPAEPLVADSAGDEAGMDAAGVLSPLTDTTRLTGVAPFPTAMAAEVDIFPTSIDEVLVCSVQGDVLYEWQCRNSELWINFLEFVSQKSRQLGQGLALGRFDRLEILGPNSRIVAQVGSSRGVIVRSSKAAPKLVR